MKIQALRNKFSVICDINEDRYHEIDVHRLLVDDWFIDRFILTNKNAYEAMTEAMVWIKDFKAYERKDDDFPLEFYEMQDPHLYGRDKFGRIIIWNGFRIG